MYVFAVTQLSHYLLAHPTLTGALRTGLLPIMVWLLWVYTTWVANWLDPRRIAVRLLLLGLAGASLVGAAADELTLAGPEAVGPPVTGDAGRHAPAPSPAA